MTDSVNNPLVGGVGAVGKAPPQQKVDVSRGDGAESFRNVLDRQAASTRADQAARMAQMQAPPTAPVAEVGELKFSAHAQARMRTRAISFSPNEMERIQAAVGKAAAKGARESLLLINNKALVVSVPNRTVITAVDEASMKQNVFTNIDSAIIL
jgi:flagellar operon protein